MVLPFFDYFLFAASNPLDPPEVSAPVLTVIIGVGGLLTAGVLVLTFAKLWRDVLGKTPAIAVDIGTHSKEDKDAKAEPGTKRFEFDLTGLVATRDFEAHKEEVRLRTVGLEKQISESRHDWKAELQAVLLAAKLRDELTEEWRGEISEDVKQSAQKIAAVKQQADMIFASQNNMDAKLDRLIERHIPPLAPAKS